MFIDYRQQIYLFIWLLQQTQRCLYNGTNRIKVLTYKYVSL